METLKTKWEAFIKATSSEMAAFNPEEAKIFLDTLLPAVPPDEAMFELATAYVSFQQATLRLTETYLKHERMSSAALVATMALALARALESVELGSSPPNTTTH